MNDVLEFVNELAQRRRVELGVVLGSDLGLFRDERVLEARAVDAEHDSAEHLQEAAVGIPREALVAGQGGQAGDGFVVEAEIQDGVHHARHRKFGARAHADEQRVRGRTERLAGLDLERR